MNMRHIILISVIILMLTSCGKNEESLQVDNDTLTQNEVLDVIEEEVENNDLLLESDVVASWNKVYLYSYPYKCEILWTTTYYYPEKAMEFTGFSTSGVKNNTLIRDGKMYSWAIVESANFLAFAEVEDDPGIYTDEEMEEKFSEWFNDMVEKLQNQFKDSCEAWDLDESLFELPEWVTFEQA